MSSPDPPCSRRTGCPSQRHRASRDSIPELRSSRPPQWSADNRRAVEEAGPADGFIGLAGPDGGVGKVHLPLWISRVGGRRVRAVLEELRSLADDRAVLAAH